MEEVAEAREVGHGRDAPRGLVGAEAAVEVAAEPDVVGAHEAHDVVHVAEDGVERDLALAEERRVEHHAHEAAAGADGADLRVREVAAVGAQGRGVAVARDDEARVLREHVVEGAGVEVGEVRHDAARGHLLEQAAAGVGEAGVVARAAGIAVGRVPRDADEPYAAFDPARQLLRVADRVGALHEVDDADGAAGLAEREVARALEAEEVVLVPLEERVVERDLSFGVGRPRLVLPVAVGGEDRREDGREASPAQVRQGEGVPRGGGQGEVAARLQELGRDVLVPVDDQPAHAGSSSPAFYTGPRVPR